jgi:peptide/nickel transport system permease protein
MSNLRLAWIKFSRDKLAFSGFLIVFSLVLVAVFAGALAPYPEDTFRIHPAERLQPPSLKHYLGTDSMGRDIFSRLLFGARVTLVICIHSVILALSITYWPWFTRIVYAETRSLKKTAFIEAAEALGASTLRTLLLHVPPNVSSSIIVRSSIGMGFTILTAATLGFLGVGAQPPTPEWGVTIAESREYLPDAWWYATFPGFAIFLVVMGFNMLGDGLRDILDPRIRRGFD